MCVESSQLSALLQLASAALPVGAFSHSLGLEAACEAAAVHDAASAERWIADYLALVWAGAEAPLWCAQYAAWGTLDAAMLAAGNAQLLAMRDTAEQRMESAQTGRSLALWLQSLPELPACTAAHRAILHGLRQPAYASVHAGAAQMLGLDAHGGLHALGWSVAENLVTAAVKLVPLGQVAGQSILRRVAALLPALIARALEQTLKPALEPTPEQAPSRALDAALNFAPMLSILCARHETQYTRLFRS